jgi:hypothetical protein
LLAIAAEAQELSDKQRGHASAALKPLARSYALVTSGATAVTPTNEVTVPIQQRAGGHQVGICLETEP